MIPVLDQKMPAEDLELLVVIVCYKAVDLTIACLESLSSQISVVPRTKVAICENGTGVDAVEALEHAIVRNGWTDWTRLKAIHPNRGFSGGNNAILRDVLGWPRPPQYIMLVNADTIVKPGALAHLHAAIEADPKLGIVGPRLVGEHGEGQVSCFRGPSALSEFLRAAQTGPIHRLFGRSNFELAPAPSITNFDWVSFACAIIRSDVLCDVGLLDEGFYLYFDDADYCRRARRAGWSIGNCENAVVVHLVGRSNSVPSDAKARRRRPRYFYASRSRYFAKHFGRGGLWLANLGWTVGRWISLFRELIGHKKRHICAGEWRDIWTNFVDPIASSEPEPSERRTGSTSVQGRVA